MQASLFFHPPFYLPYPPPRIHRLRFDVENFVWVKNGGIVEAGFVFHFLLSLLISSRIFSTQSGAHSSIVIHPFLYFSFQTNPVTS